MIPARGYSAHMADNSARIAEIRAKLRAGASRVSTDGVDVSYDFDALQAELRRLELEDDALQSVRPVASSIYLGGF